MEILKLHWHPPSLARYLAGAGLGQISKKTVDSGFFYNTSGNAVMKQLNTSCSVKAQKNPVPVLRIAASRGFSELTKNVIRSSHGYSTPSLKISCKMVEPFYGNLADKEIKHYQSLDGST